MSEDDEALFLILFAAVLGFTLLYLLGGLK